MKFAFFKVNKPNKTDSLELAVLTETHEILKIWNRKQTKMIYILSSKCTPKEMRKEIIANFSEGL